MIRSSIQDLTKCASFFIILILLVQLSGCRFYKVNSLILNHKTGSQNIETMQKYFLVYARGSIYVLEDITSDSTSISGNIVKPSKIIYYYPGRPKDYQKEQESILQEVHIYSS